MSTDQKTVMKCPYNQLELSLALLRFNSKLEKGELDDNKIQQVALESPGHKFPESKADQNKVIAEANGIDVPTLINSPNYAVLVAEYKHDLLRKTINDFQEKAGLNNDEAWALVMASVGEFDKF